MTEKKENKIVEAIEEYLNSSIAYLSISSDYARGYKEGIWVAREIIRDIIENNKEQ